ncbi:MAG: rhomboid family intramembrane serine protease [Natronospirillum sp.]|uniref:rhomboid family intramembrane serine protease n=1 Tax=Natronospirillum sp. TaxID=2812955 RepID=UPI0025EE28EA|nr:rhomboid family intramembrane serine protease [Natronospirillum sp.]MCH8551377.1 rhomboid family intramembrane serine protease [Natronospirillum sp.]
MTRFATAVYRVPALTPLVLLLLYVPGWYWSQWWQFDRQALGATAPEWWRWWGAHLAHGTVEHAVSNALAIVVAALVAPRWMNRLPGLLLAAFLMAGVSLGIWLNNPDIDVYRGFSGVGHGWLMLAFAWSPWFSPWTRIAVVVGIMLKVVWEESDLFMIAQWSGYFADAPVLTDAHWYGVLLAVPGVILAYLAQFIRERMN